MISCSRTDVKPGLKELPLRTVRHSSLRVTSRAIKPGGCEAPPEAIDAPPSLIDTRCDDPSPGGPTAVDEQDLAGDET